MDNCPASWKRYGSREYAGKIIALVIVVYSMVFILIVSIYTIKSIEEC